VIPQKLQNDESNASFWKTAGFRDVKHSLQRLSEYKEAVRRARGKVTESISALAATRSLHDSPGTSQSSYEAVLKQYDTAYRDDCEIWGGKVVSDHRTIMAASKAIRSMHEKDPHAIGDARIYSPMASPDILPSTAAGQGGHQRGRAEAHSEKETLPASYLGRSVMTSTGLERAYLEYGKFTNYDDLLGVGAIANFKGEDTFDADPNGILSVRPDAAPVKSKVDGVVHVPEDNDTAYSTRTMAREIPLPEALCDSALLRLLFGATDENIGFTGPLIRHAASGKSSARRSPP
jgi:hypothetical protein